MTKEAQYKFSFLILVSLSFHTILFSQNCDSSKVINNFGGAVSVTNNGISFIPVRQTGRNI